MNRQKSELQSNCYSEADKNTNPTSIQQLRPSLLKNSQNNLYQLSEKSKSNDNQIYNSSVLALECKTSEMLRLTKMEQMVWQFQQMGYQIQQIQEETWVDDENDETKISLYSFADATPLTVQNQQNLSDIIIESQNNKGSIINYRLSKLKATASYLKEQYNFIKQELIMRQLSQQQLFKKYHQQILLPILEKFLQLQKNKQCLQSKFEGERCQLNEKVKNLIAENFITETENNKYREIIKQLSQQNNSLQNYISSLECEKEELIGSNLQLQQENIQINECKTQLHSYEDTVSKQDNYIYFLQQKINDFEIAQDQQLQKMKEGLQNYAINLNDKLYNKIKNIIDSIEIYVSGSQYIQRISFDQLIKAVDLFKQVTYLRGNLVDWRNDINLQEDLDTKFNIGDNLSQNFELILNTIDSFKRQIFDFVQSSEKVLCSNQSAFQSISNMLIQFGNQLTFEGSSPTIDTTEKSQTCKSFTKYSFPLLKNQTSSINQFSIGEKSLPLSNQNKGKQSTISQYQHKNQQKISRIIKRLRSKIEIFHFDTIVAH